MFDQKQVILVSLFKKIRFLSGIIHEYFNGSLWHAESPLIVPFSSGDTPGSLL